MKLSPLLLALCLQACGPDIPLMEGKYSVTLEAIQSDWGLPLGYESQTVWKIWRDPGYRFKIVGADWEFDVARDQDKFYLCHTQDSKLFDNQLNAVIWAHEDKEQFDGHTNSEFCESSCLLEHRRLSGVFITE